MIFNPSMGTTLSSQVALFGHRQILKNHDVDDSGPSDAPNTHSPSRYRRNTQSSSSLVTVDYGGLLTKDVPLAVDAQVKLRKAIDAWKARQPPSASDGTNAATSLVELLLRSIPEEKRPAKDEPEKMLNALLNSKEGQALGKLLQDSIDVLPTATSIREVLLSALVLDVDPAGGLSRDELAGYSLRQQSNWGYSPAEIVKRFEAHLAARFGEAHAKTIAFQLLSISAPEFLVQGLPATMVYGSHQWATFSAAVASIEARQPGTTAVMTYDEITALDEVEPASEVEKREQQFAQVTAVIDWAIANGVILENAEDAYSPADIERAVNAMEEHYKTLTDSVVALTTPMPTRRELALDELRRVYGVENEKFFEEALLADTVPGAPGRKAYSLLDIYMSGDLGKHFWISSDADFTTVKVNLGFSKLADIKKSFEEKFDTYIQGLKDAFRAQFKFQLSLLPLEDRRLFEYGKVTTFNLVAPDVKQEAVSPEHKIRPYINNGAILIRAELEGETCHYLYSPSQGRIIKDANPASAGLRFPGSRLYFSMLSPDSPGGKEPPVTVMWQTVGSPTPKKDPVDLLAFSIYPNKSLEVEVPGEHPHPPTTFTSKKSDGVAGSVSAYYTRGLDEAKTAANGSTQQEREVQLSNSVRKFFLGLIPFYSTVESFIDGKPIAGFFNLILDVFGFFVPGLKGGIQGVKLGLKSGMGAAKNFIKGFGKSALKASNPLEAVFDGSLGVFRLGKAGYKRLRSFGGRSGSFDLLHSGNKDGIAEGIYRRIGAKSDGVPVIAVERNGKWYALDRATHTPYGAPLRGFVPSSGSAALNIAKGIAVDIAISLSTFWVQKKLNTHYAATDVRVGSVSPGDVKASETGSATEYIDPAVRSRLGACTTDATELRKMLEVLGAEVTEGSVKWSDQPLEIIDQLEAELLTLEEYTRETAEGFEVFFKPYDPGKTPSQQNQGLAGRVDTVEKRMTAIRTALAQIQVKLNDVAA